MDIVFLGSGAFGLPTLERLAREHAVRGVVTQPDRPAGRGGRVTPTPIGAYAARALAGVPVVKPEDVNEAEVAGTIRGWRADAWVVIAFGQKLSPGLLAGRFAINLHASLLPRWRGAAPINWAVLSGDAETGNSVIGLAERMDAGVVYAQGRRAIEATQTAGDLHDLLAADGAPLVARVLEAHARGEARGEAQDESRVTLARKLRREDGFVDFKATAEECRRRIHGLNPWPGVTSTFREEGLKLWRVRVAEASRDAKPGTIVDAAAGIVACGAGTALRLVEVQPAGGRSMGWEEFARGRHVKTGEAITPGAEP